MLKGKFAEKLQLLVNEMIVVRIQSKVPPAALTGG